MARSEYRPYCTKGCAGRPYVWVAESSLPERVKPSWRGPRSAPCSGKLDTFAALTVPTMCPLVCCAASGLFYPCEAQSEVAEKGAKRAMHAELLRLAHPSPPLSSAGDG